jgi:glycosyltransferase involved in cell wall biosynthesis
VRIAFLNPSGTLGGAEISLINILASLREAQPDWSFHLILGGDGPLVKSVRSLGVPTDVLPFSPALAALGDSGSDAPEDARLSRFNLLKGLTSALPGSFRYIAQLRSALRDIKPDVIHTNGLKMHVLGLWARPKLVPVVWHIHDYVRPRPVMARLLRKYAPQCRTIVANSNSVAEDVRSLCGATRDVRTVYNAVNLAKFCPIGPRLDLDSLGGYAPPIDGAVRVGLLGTMAWWKGHKTFLKAISLLPPTLSLRAYIVGGALYQTRGSQCKLDDLRRLAAELNISDRVVFTGFVDDPASAMRSLDIVVHASTRPEPFGLVIAEAMACGRAVIASDAGGASELLNPGVNALGHPPGDAAALARAIVELASNPALRVKFGTNARATAESRFDRSRLAKEIVPIYRQAASIDYARSACA